jgi:hypothetical protein
MVVPLGFWMVIGGLAGRLLVDDMDRHGGKMSSATTIGNGGGWTVQEGGTYTGNS